MRCFPTSNWQENWILSKRCRQIPSFRNTCCGSVTKEQIAASEPLDQKRPGVEDDLVDGQRSAEKQGRQPKATTGQGFAGKGFCLAHRFCLKEKLNKSTAKPYGLANPEVADGRKMVVIA